MNIEDDTDFTLLKTGIPRDEYLDLVSGPRKATEEEVMNKLETEMQNYTHRGGPLRGGYEAYEHMCATVELNLKRTQSTLINGYLVYDVTFEYKEGYKFNHEEEYFLFFEKPSRTTLTQFSSNYRKGEHFLTALVSDYHIMKNENGTWSNNYNPILNIVASAIGLDKLPSYWYSKDDLGP